MYILETVIFMKNPQKLNTMIPGEIKVYQYFQDFDFLVIYNSTNHTSVLV